MILSTVTSPDDTGEIARIVREGTRAMPIYDPAGPPRRPDAEGTTDTSRSFSFVTASTGELPLIVDVADRQAHELAEPPRYVGRHRAPDDDEPAAPPPARWSGSVARLLGRSAR